MKVLRCFFYSVAILLLITAAAKLISSGGYGKILLSVDPVTGFQIRYLLRIIGGIEIVVALVCLFSKQIWFRAGLSAWLGTCFLGYRLGLIFIGYHKPCSCLGNLTDALHISPQTADTAMKIILAYLLIGSYSILFWLWRQKRKTLSAMDSPKTPVSSV